MRLLLALILAAALVLAEDSSNDDIEGHTSGTGDSDNADADEQISNGGDGSNDEDEFEGRSSQTGGPGVRGLSGRSDFGKNNAHSGNTVVNVAIAAGSGDKPAPGVSQHSTVINSVVNINPVVGNVRPNVVGVNPTAGGTHQTAGGHRPSVGNASPTGIITPVATGHGGVPHLAGGGPIALDDFVSGARPHSLGGVGPGADGFAPATGGITQVAGGITPVSGVTPVAGGIPPIPTGLTPTVGGIGHAGSLRPLAGVRPGIAARPCRFWCTSPTGQYYCCQTPEQSHGLGVLAKHGWCPPARPMCSNFRLLTAPQRCNSDLVCSGVDKCCLDTCLRDYVCKPPYAFGG
ncbi:elastin-like isoform X2 [Macrobrachium nipponense]|uniref:elastin-like isoform X2 n=1 Tax=Macrobrachium nipponense TaxID=159736 RepID=UPI0030C836C9